MQLKTNDVQRVYVKLGMDADFTHHKLAYFRVNGKLVVKTRLSHGSGDAKAPHKIRGDFHLNEKDFQDLVNCPLSHDGYVEILRSKGLLG